MQSEKQSVLLLWRNGYIDYTRGELGFEFETWEIYTNDVFKGVEQLIKTCASNVVRVHRLPHYDHIHFMYANDVKKEVNDRIVQNLEYYSTNF